MPNETETSRTDADSADSTAAEAAFAEADFAPRSGGAESAADRRLREAEERALRAQAELENYRKRARRELDEERKYALAPLIVDLLPILDNLERAVAAAEGPGSDQASGLLTGVRMVVNQALELLGRHHCRRIDSLGAAFDPNLHEALGPDPDAERAAAAPVDTVTRELRSGYRLHERVLRPAQVFIAASAETTNRPNQD